MDKKVKQFIEQNIDLIEDGKWKDVQEKATEFFNSHFEFSEFNYSMIQAGLDPIQTLDYIPAYFIAQQPIKSYDLDPSIKIINDYAFAHCQNLDHISLANVEYIGDFVFIDCESLQHIDIPSSVTHIGKNIFRGCDNLIEIVANNNAHYACENGILFNRDKTAIISVPQAIKGNIILPNTLTEIQVDAFEDCVNLKSIFIPDSVTSIKSYAFQRCKSLENINLPEKINYIAPSGFQDCVNLKAIDIPEGVEEINSYAFAGCVSLKHVTIPETVKQIGSKAFLGCTSLVEVKLPSDMTYLGEGIFDSCKNLKSLRLPKSLKDFTALDIYSNVGDLQLILPDNTTLERFLEPISSISAAKKFKSKGDYTIIIQKTPYRINDLYKKVMEKLIKEKEALSTKIPDLYRVKTSNYTLQTTTFDKKQDKMRVRWIHDGAGQSYNCPLFFLSEKEAQDFVDRTVASHILTTPGSLEIYKARLSTSDKNFTKINTLYGPALIQSWKDDKVDAACIIEKDIF